MSKKWYQSTTVWINALLTLSSAAALVAEFLQNADFSSAALIGLCFGVVNVVNRFYTKHEISL